MSKKLNLIGRTFGKLTVIKEAYVRKDHSYFYTLCNCGNKSIIASTSLQKGNTKSCGCLKKEKSGTHSIKPFSTAAATSLYHRYKREAKKRGFEFSIPKRYFLKLTKQDCYYCGSKPSNIRKVYNKLYDTGNYIYNGIDRIDNKIGYIKENSVPCCWKCNHMKLTLTKEQYINHCKKVIQHQKRIDRKGDLK